MLEYIIERTNSYIDSMPKKSGRSMVNFLQVKKLHILWLDYMTFLITSLKSVF